ncbi:MAG: DUF4838 domain-containing protein [Kiritimatiellia bacterium]|nr:DUF4838 domain-containing protein [Lentisphaerota bacterium]
MQHLRCSGKLFMPGLWLSVVFMIPPAVFAGQKLVVVDQGVNPIPVIVFSNAPPMTRQAADDLAAYIEKASGARPEVIEGLPDPVPEHAVWVGYQPKLKDVFPALDFDFKHPEEILIACDGQNLVIAGRDRWDPDNLVIAIRRGESNGYQFEYGTANAVYTFLRDQLGVRWLWPGEEDVPEQPTIAFEPMKYRYHPTLRMRHSLFPAASFPRIGLSPGKANADWNRFNRVHLDSLQVDGGHAFGDWWERFHETHPEFFALQPDGTRIACPNPGNVKMCESNPGLWEQWLDDVEETLARNPTRRVFNAAENDSWNAGHCICPECRAWDHPDGQPRMFSWRGLSQQYVALSDRQVTFANHLGRLLKKRFPDKDYYVAILAYGNSRPPPVSAVPDDNVIIMSVNRFLHNWERPGLAFDASAEEERQNFIGWSKVTKNQVWRPNISSGGWKQGMPAGFDEIADAFRILAETGAIGVFLDNIWFYWATQGPAYYLLAQLAWNPTDDAQAVMDDYYQRGFGPAADMVQAYFELLETPYRRMVVDGRSWVEAFDAETFDQAETLLDQAGAALDGAPEKYASRLAFVRAGCEFLRLQTENRALVPVLRKAGDKADAADLEKARANWAAMQATAKKHPWFWHGGYANARLRPVVDPDWQE